jgi:predicted dehydrogenase
MTNPKTIRWGIAGTGAIARQFASDIAHARGAALAAVSARDAGKAQAFAGRFKGVSGFGSLAAMIDSGVIDAVYIATPNTVHHAQALKCIEAGMPVLVEKPLTANLGQAREIQSAARSGNVFVMEAMWSRYLPAIQAVRRAIRDGAIGTVKRIEAELAWKVDYHPEHRLFDKAQGGGSLYDLGVYPVSLTRFFLGAPDHVESFWWPAPSGVDLRAELTMQFKHAVAQIRCGFDREGSNRMLIEGDKGVIALGPLFIKAEAYAVYRSRAFAELAQPGGPLLAARVRRKLFRHLPLPHMRRHHAGFDGSGLQFEIEAASRAISQGHREEPDNTLDDSIATLRIIDGVLAKPPAMP